MPSWQSQYWHRGLKLSKFREKINTTGWNKGVWGGERGPIGVGEHSEHFTEGDICERPTWTEVWGGGITIPSERNGNSANAEWLENNK